MAKKLILDFDNTITNSTKAFVDVYNLIHGRQFLHSDQEKPNWEDVRLYDFKDQIPTLTSAMKHTIFDSATFYEIVEYYDQAKEIITELSRETEVHIVSMSSYNSALHKGKKIAKDFPHVHFQPIIYPNYKDKAHIDMRNSIFIDDVSKNLVTSSAERNICFRYRDITMDVNKDWHGEVLTKWDMETYKYLKELLEIR